MILTCPSCRTRYQAEASRFVPNGRNVRCAKCGQVWFQTAPEAEAQPEFPAAEVPVVNAAAASEAAAVTAVLTASSSTAAADFGSVDFGSIRSETVDPADHSETHRKGRSWTPPPAQIAGWAALILMLIAIGWSAVQYRQTIANLWPESASLYATLGMPVNVRGMALVNIAYQQDFEDGQPVLSVTGKVVNISNHDLPVPGLRVVLTDDSKHELYRWTFDAGIPTLKAGAESNFVTRLSSPPPEARNLNISFADGGPG